MTFNCFCGQKIDLNDSAQGQSFNCPSCNTTLVAPIIPKPPQFVQCPCQHCGIYIEFDSSYVGLSVKCPRCFESTKLFIPEAPVESKAEAKFSEHHDIYEGQWVNDPMTDKQKAMLVLYGIQFNEGMTKGEASRLIDQAVHSGQPTIHNQAKGGELFGKIRLNEITQ